MADAGALTVESYLASLPAGLDSYPDCQQKASVFRVFLAGIRPESFSARLPPTLATLATSPPPVNLWLPEVHAHAVFIAAREAAFADDEAYERFAYRQNAALLESPLYSILFKFVSPERVIRGAPSRWGHFHRGMTLVPEMSEPGRAALRLQASPGLLPPLLARCYGTAFRAALEAAGAKHVSVELTPIESRAFRYAASWM